MDRGSENEGSPSHHGLKYSNEDARKCFLCLKLSISEILNESWAIYSQCLSVIFFITVRFYWWNKWSQAESLQLVLMATVHGGSSTLLFYPRWTPREPETFRRWASGSFTGSSNFLGRKISVIWISIQSWYSRCTDRCIIRPPMIIIIYL